MRKIHISIVLAIMIIAASCQKQEDVSINKIETGEISFAPMKVGNYWIYEVGTVDKSNNYIYKSIDSTYIAATKKINGKDYFEYRSSSSATFVQYLRDSSGYLVDNKGIKYMSADNFKDTLYSKVVKVYGVLFSKTYRLMYKPSSNIITKAGSFRAVEARNTTQYYSFTNRKVSSHAYYAPNIGLVLRKDMPNISMSYTVYNLKRYHVN